jgi:hypothetical protein
MTPLQNDDNFSVLHSTGARPIWKAGKPPTNVFSVYTLCSVHDICEIPMVTTIFFVVFQHNRTEVKAMSRWVVIT